ncbi:MAG: hypothetical protein ACOYK8_00895 [Alphaproteobacteria bacterium]
MALRFLYSWIPKKHPQIIILLSMLLLNIAGAGYFFEKTSQEKERTHQLLKHTKALTQEITAKKIGQSISTLENIYSEAMETGGNLEKMRHLINNRITRAGLDLRVAWSDKDKMLRIGTIIGIFKNNDDTNIIDNDVAVDLSHRDYIEMAIREPQTIHLSAIRPHSITGRDFFAIAMGVAGKNGLYFGCLASIIDVENLREAMAELTQNQPLYLRLTMPNGQILWSNFQEKDQLYDQHLVTTEGLHIELAYSHLAYKKFIQRTILLAIISLLLANLLLYLLHYYYQSFFTAPLEKIKASFEDLPDRIFYSPPLCHPLNIQQKANAVGQLLTAYDKLQTENQHLQTEQEQALRFIQHLHQQQISFLDAASAEMEEAFHILHHYNEFLQGNVRHNYFHDDELFLENVLDVTQNLKFMANSFYLISRHQSGHLYLRPHKTDIALLIEEALFILQPVLEWRAIDLDINCESIISTHYDQTILKHIIWGSLYLCYRFIDDGSTLTINLQREGDNIIICLQASCFITKNEHDKHEALADFFPQYKQEQQQFNVEKVRKHINTVIIGYFTHYMGGSITVDSHQESGFIAKIQLKI